MDVLRIVLLTLHITAAAIMLAGGLGLTKLLRASASAASKELLAIATQQLRRALLTKTVSASAVFVTGLSLIFVSYGGFGGAPPTIHAALTVVLLWFVIDVALVRTTQKRITLITQSESLDAARLLAASKRLALGQGIQHLFWIVMLVLMMTRY